MILLSQSILIFVFICSNLNFYSFEMVLEIKKHQKKFPFLVLFATLSFTRQMVFFLKAK